MFGQFTDDERAGSAVRSGDQDFHVGAPSDFTTKKRRVEVKQVDKETRDWSPGGFVLVSSDAKGGGD
jgi:hypothetical protein